MSEMKDEIFNKDFAVRIKKCQTAAEIMAVARDFNIELTEEPAEVQLQHLVEYRARCVTKS